MSTEPYPAEPWFSCESAPGSPDYDPDFACVSLDEEGLQIILWPDQGLDTSVQDAIVRRVAACVNACAGVSTEALEGGVVADLVAGGRQGGGAKAVSTEPTPAPAVTPAAGASTGQADHGPTAPAAGPLARLSDAELQDYARGKIVMSRRCGSWADQNKYRRWATEAYEECVRRGRLELWTRAVAAANVDREA